MSNVKTRPQKVHLVGIGGVGMTGLAFLLRGKGFIVSGSDIKNSYNTDMLKKEMFDVYIGHRKENVYNADLVCYSSAVKEDNIEVKEAKRRGIRIVKRAELLAMLSYGDKNIVVSGSHGKTTTSALAAFVLSRLNYNPNVFVGSVALNFGKYAWTGKDLFVFEADESDRSFLYYKPWALIITNIDYEHLNFYGSFSNLQASFKTLADKSESIVIGCGDDKNVEPILENAHSLSYGLESYNCIRADNLHFYARYTVFDLIMRDARYKDVKIPLLGAHNVLNTLAVISLCVHLKEPPEKFIPVLSDFKGTRRRLQFKETISDITFVDDYAHHPNEIKAVLNAVKHSGYSRIVVVFQPHRYTRVSFLHREFTECFSGCGCLIITDIYPAGEAPIEGISGQYLYAEIKKKFTGHIAYIPKDRLVDEVPELLERGDLVIGMGAGDINIIMNAIMDKIKSPEDIKV